ncbi:hypothetical protein Ato02nite_029970 [Paractinoplanes toevensis]|uniref:Uncharacterized protein n=2 Tax=Paractinoplanes toevensis TaxID=571911 RepID=A0A919W254_9ACTN|nr:hypothetical protein Ato02nite_029970 [Actinoplanes toevensis]
MLLAGCASTDPAAAPSTVTVVVSVTGADSSIPVPVPAPVTSGAADCARGPNPVPSLDPSASFDVNDPEQRARRALAEQYRPTPTRGVVPAAAVPGAEACVHFLRMQFSLLAAGSGAAPGEPEVESALRSAGLTRIIVRSGPVFAASAGDACVHGSFTAAGPDFVIAPPAADGSCGTG